MGAIVASTLSSPALAHHTKLPKEFEPRLINLKSNWTPGTIHVLPKSRRLYFVTQHKKAMKFVVGIGRQGLYESGTFTIRRKARWPSWRPTNEMIERDPKQYAKFRDGVPGGPDNPLGARALYLYDSRGRDTYLRIHGTNKPWTINSAVSNGCVRLANPHVEKLYSMVPIGTRVILH